MRNNVAMAARTDDDAAERFGTGAGLGWAGTVGLGVLAVVRALEDPSLGTAVGALGLAWGALVLYLGLVRPQVVAYPDHLLLRGSFRDSELPWHLIDGVAVRQSLRVHTDGRVLQSAAVSGGLRSGRRAVGRDALGLQDRVQGLVPGGVEAGRRVHPAVDVETRLRDLASARSDASQHRSGVTQRWAVVETVVFAALTAAATTLVVVWAGT